MLKKIGTGILLYIVTFIIGVGLGLGTLIIMNRGRELGFLKWWYKDDVVGDAPQEMDAAAVVEEASMSAELTADSASDSGMYSEVSRDASLLVLNASQQAGVAGAAATKLKEAGYAVVRTRNLAKSYDPGAYIFMHERDDVVIGDISSILNLELLFDTRLVSEDASQSAEVVVVLSE